MLYRKIGIKLFILMLTICFMTVFTFANTDENKIIAEYSRCLHPSNSVVESSYPETRFCVALNANQHGYYEKVHRQCVRCWHEEFVDKLVRVEAHSFVFEDLGHMGNTHRYRHICYSCSYTKDYSLICSGSPHVSPFTLS